MVSCDSKGINRPTIRSIGQNKVALFRAPRQAFPLDGSTDLRMASSLRRSSPLQVQPSGLFHLHNRQRLVVLRFHNRLDWYFLLWCIVYLFAFFSKREAFPVRLHIKTPRSSSSKIQTLQASKGVQLTSQHWKSISSYRLSIK